MDTVRKLKYLCNGINVGEGCEAVVTAITRCWWVKLRECGELLHNRRFPQKLKGAVSKSYVRPAISYKSKAWCPKESELGLLPRTERSTMRAMCGVKLIDRKGAKNMMLTLGLNESIE